MCGACGFSTSSADEVLEHDCPKSGATTFGYDRGVKVGDRTVALCKACGYSSGDVKKVMNHECPALQTLATKPSGRRHAFVALPDHCAECGESLCHVNHWMRPGKWKYDEPEG